MRVVVDTNVLVSFAIRPNPLFEKFFGHIAERGILLVSDERAAINGRADTIVSGNDHLLSMGSFRGIPIQSASSFLKNVAT